MSKKSFTFSHMLLASNNLAGYKLIAATTTIYYLNDFRKFRSHKLYGTAYGPQPVTSEDELEKALVGFLLLNTSHLIHSITGR